MTPRHPLVEAFKLIVGGAALLTFAVLAQPQVAAVLITLAAIWLSYLLP